MKKIALSAIAFLAVSSAALAEPVKLSDTAMDSVTAAGYRSSSRSGTVIQVASIYQSQTAVAIGRNAHVYQSQTAVIIQSNHR